MTMTIQKQLSHLSIAAIMLVFATLPVLAQTGSVDNQTAVATTSNLVESSQVAALRAALRKNRPSVSANESTSVAPPAVTEKQPSFSLDQFVESAIRPAVIDDSTVFTLTSLERPRFDHTSPKKITFVPSRGPKWPWQ